MHQNGRRTDLRPSVVIMRHMEHYGSLRDLDLVELIFKLAQANFRIWREAHGVHRIEFNLSP
jgi:hypothetical protein